MPSNHIINNFNPDPNQSLPQELFCRLLSFIEPIPKASCNLVARSWNNAITSDPNTHKVIDLSRMKRENPLDLANRKDPLVVLPEKVFISLLCSLPSSSIITAAQASKAWLELISRNTRRLGFYSDFCRFADNRQLNRILMTFNRLSSLAQHKVVKVSLNLSSFYEEFKVWDLRFPKVDDDLTKSFNNTGLGRLLKALDECKSLQVIHIQIDPNAVLEENKISYPMPPSSPFYMVLKIIEVFMTFGQLDIICINAPVDLTVQAESRTPSFKSFSLIGNDEGKIFEVDRYQILPLLKNVKTFLRSESARFTKYHLPCVGHEYEDQDDDWQDLGVISGWGESGILTLLSESKFSLQSLDNSVSFNSDAAAVWEFARDCSNLTSLSLDLVGADGSAHDEEILVFPDHCLSIKRLEMRSNRHSIDFNSIQRWAGSRVEELVLADFTCAQDGLVSFLLQSRFTLKSIKIDRLRIDYNPDALASLFSSNSLSFPNLESLTLNTAHLSLCRFFTMIDSPKLSTLEMNNGFFWDRTIGRPDFNSLNKIFLDSFLSLLSRCNLSLTNIKFGGSKSREPLLPGPPLFFPRIQKIRITDPLTLETWLSKCKFPSLADLSVKEHSLRKEFRRNSPGLLPIERF